MRRILLLFIISISIFAYDLDPLFLFDSSVDVRTGEWILYQNDAVYRSLEGKWYLYPHTHLTLYGPQYEKAEVREKTGLLLTYTLRKENLYRPILPHTVTNTAMGKIGARTNLQNQILFRADKFTFVLETPDKTLRIYQKSHHTCQNLHFLLLEERLADGTVLRYKYDQDRNLYAINGSKILLPSNKELISGRVTEQDGTIYTYEKDKTIACKRDKTKTIYFFTPEMRLSCIEQWDERGNLIQKTPYLFSDEGLLLKKGTHTYCYDERGNPIEEKTDEVHLTRKFDSEDRVAFLTEKKEGRTLTTHFAYSKEGVLSNVAIDDGKHLRVINIEGGPDTPTAIFEKANDMLLKVTRYTYTKDSISENIYNPDGTLCFSRKITAAQIHKPWLDDYPIGTSIENGYKIKRDYLGRMIARQRGNRKERWTYNALFPISKTDEHGLTTSYRYNTAGQKIEETLLTQKGAIATTFDYDARGRLTKTARGEIVTHFAYNERDEVIETREETKEGLLLTRNAPPPQTQPPLNISLPKKIQGLHTETDIFGNITCVRTEDGSVHYTMTYNTRNQPLCVTDHITGRKGYRIYDDLGNLVEETLLNGLTLKSERDVYGRRTEFTLPDDSKIFMRFGIKFLEEIRRISHKRKDDYLHQFIEYNLLGFPVRQRQITGFGEIFYDVDEKANVIGIHSRFFDETLKEAEVIDIPSPIIPYTFQTDGLGRIIEISQPGRDLTFTYDVWNRRMTKTVIEKEQDSRYDPVDLAFFYDDTKEIGAISRYHGKLIELRVIPETRVSTGDGAISYELANLLYLPQFDLFGNPSRLISVSRGKLMESYQFSPSGACEIRDIYGSTLKSSKALNPWGFQGYRKDPETGLYYMGNTYYDPGLRVDVPSGNPRHFLLKR